MTGTADLMHPADRLPQVRVALLTGASVRLSRPDLQGIISHPRTLTACLILGLVHAFILASSFPPLPPVAFAAVVLVGSLISNAISGFTIRVAASSAIWRKRGAVRATFVHAAAVGVTTMATGELLHHFGGINISARQILLLIVFSTLLYEGASTLFIELWLPAILADARNLRQSPVMPRVVGSKPQGADLAANKAPGHSGVTPVLIGEHAYDCADIMLLRAQNDYVAVIGRTGQQLVRARLSDTIMQIPPRFGRQIHRSVWLANSAVAGAERTVNRDITIVTRSGERFPVARARHQEVRAWVEELGLDITHSGDERSPFQGTAELST